MILIIGRNGQVARALKQQLGDRAQVLGRPECDLADSKLLEQKLNEFDPEAVVNAAAYTAVDKAEDETAMAHKINAEAPKMLAEYCKSKSIPFVHYSTDYVFSGQGDKPWLEDDPVDPINAYGQSKLEGEQAIEQVGGDFLILRTSWVYDASGKNFVNSMLRLAAEREELGVVADQLGAPTYAPDLADTTLKMLEKAKGIRPFPRGVYHVCNSGETSWFGFAQAIFDQAEEMGWSLKINKLNAIHTEDFPTPARRPHNSRLNMEKLKNTFNLEMPHWQQSLEVCLKEKRQSESH